MEDASEAGWVSEEEVEGVCTGGRRVSARRGESLNRGSEIPTKRWRGA